MPVIYSPLNDSELDSICLSLVNQELPYFSAFHEAFVLLYLTGCRVEEIFAVHRWERLQGYEMMFLPQKDNYWRYVTLDSRCDSFIDAVVNRYKPFGGLSSGQLNSVFYNFSEYSNFRVGSKPVSLYLFRYNFIRRLFNDGLNINQIADKMGYTSTTVVGGYLTAEIEKGFFLDTEGFVNINGTWWAQNYLEWNDGLGGIIVNDIFGDGQPIYYYNREAFLRYLNLYPSFRLPVSSDFDAIIDFLQVAYNLKINSFNLPDIRYWTNVSPVMINFLNMCFKGVGFCSDSTFYDVRQYNSMWLDRVSGNRQYYIRLSYSGSLYNQSTLPFSFYMPVRLILTV